MNTSLKIFVATVVLVSAGNTFAHDRDDNPPGPRGGPGTNWENPPGPIGGPGTSPDTRYRWYLHPYVYHVRGCCYWHDYDNNPPGPRGGPGTNWENPPGPRGGPGASPNRRGWWKRH